MNAKVGSLNVDLTLETARFQKGLNDAQRGMAGTQKSLTGLGGAVAGVGKAFAAAGAVLAASGLVSGLVDAATKGLALASSLGEAAKALGVSAREMQEFRFAASQAGVAQETMDKGLAKLTRTIGEAARGSGSGAKSFRELGIDVRDANGNLKSAGVVFMEVTRALEGVPGPAEKARHQVAIFGKAGQQLAPLMAEGAKGVENLRKEAHSLGIVLSDEQIKNADDTADKIDALKQALNARIAAVVGENAKEIGVLAEALAQLAENAIKALAAWLRFRNAQEKAGKEIALAKDILDKRKDLTPEQRDIAKKEVRRIIEGWNGLQTDRNEVVGGGLLTIRRTTQTGAGAKANLAGASPFASGFQKGVAKGMARLGDLSAEEQDNRLFALGDNLALDRINNKLVPALRQVRSEMEGLSLEMEGLADTSETTNVKVVRSFREMADDTLASLNGLANAIKGGGFLDILTSIIGLGVQLGSIGVFGKKMQASLNKPIPAYASGTAFHPGGLALVGERGPELLHLPRGSAVTPNHRLGGAMRVEVVPSPFFDVRVQENITAAAPGIAQAGAMAGARRAAYRQSRRLA